MPAPVAGVDGAWSCQQCGNVNFAARTACNRCQTPQAGGGAVERVGWQPGPPAMPKGCGGGKGGAPVPGQDGNWQCPQCQNVNFAIRTVCNRCQAPQPAPQHYPGKGGKGGGGGRGGPVAGIEGNWACPQCRNVNYAMRDACNKCQAPKPTEADTWACLLCQNINSVVDNVCTVCEYPRSSEDGQFVDNLAQELSQQPVPAGPPPNGSSSGKSGGKGRPEAGVDGNWACPQPLCQNVNFAMREVCNRCQTPKPGAGVASKPVPQEVWTAPQQELGPPQWAGGKGGKGAPVAGADGNWLCPNCQNVNFAVRNACNRCQAPKPMPVVARVVQPPPQWGGPPGGGKGAPVAGVNGSWACPSCGNVNFAAREVCNRCQTPKSHAQHPGAYVPQPVYVHQPTVVQAPPKGGKGGGGPVHGVDGAWACPSCQNVNFAVRTACNRCQAPKPPQGPPPGGKGGPMAGVDGNWQCPQCRNVNFALRAVCNRCQAPNPGNQVHQPQPYQPPQKGGAPKGGKGGPVAGVDGNWTCLECKNVNFGMREVCNRCQAPKSEYQPGDDFADADLIAQLSQPAPDVFDEPPAKRGRLY